ncbi:hypothetical protein AAVH_23214 [Aphelenchoides avenae]|nr:hypothetical protein AAVH_23214 [Aphelenchus avenae]
MPEIDGSGHADCIVTRDAQKTTYKFATGGWTTNISVYKSGYLSMSRVEGGGVRCCPPMRPSQAIPTKKRRIV